MNTIRFAIAAALAATGFAHAAEVTEFSNTPSVKSRAEVQAEAQAAAKAGQLRHDFVGRTVEPMSVRSRDEVRQEAATHSRRDEQRAWLFVGG